MLRQSEDLVLGFGLGIGLCLLAFFVYRGIVWSTKNMSVFFKPQMVAFPTKATPFQIFMNWVRGCTTLILIIGVIVSLALIVGGQEIRSVVVPIAIFLVLIGALSAISRK